MSGYTRLSKIFAKSNGNIFFECPACETPHGINCGGGHGPVWSWDGDVNKPTFSPSLLVTHIQLIDPLHSDNKREHVCHSFVRYGRIEYLSDCTHELAGKTVDIPEWEIECEGDAKQIIECQHCHKQYPDETPDAEFIAWHGLCAECEINSPEADDGR